MLESVITKLRTEQPFLSLEISPSLSGKIEQDVNGLESLNKVDCFVCTDSPLARLKPSSILNSIKLQNILHKPVICTISMRDRNSIALCGDILGANEIGLRAFLCLTGDSVENGDCKDSKGVFEGNSLKLGKIIQGLNNGIAINGKVLKEKVEPIYNFHSVNAYANNPESLVRKMQKKMINSPVEAFFTQPIFLPKQAEFLLEQLAGLNAKLHQNCTMILGFFPVLKYSVAIFLRDKLPGCYIPDEWITKLYNAKLKGKQEEYEVGLALSKELWLELHTLHNKFHFMSANNPNLIKEFI